MSSIRPELGGKGRSLAAREKLPPVVDPLNALSRDPALAMRLAVGGVSSGPPPPPRLPCEALAGDARSAALPE